MRYALPLLLLSLGSAFGQQSVPFPMAPLGSSSIPGTEEFQPDPAQLDALTELSDIVLVGFPLPGLGSVDLGLERIEVDPADYGLQVDGVATPLVTLDQTLWKGRVAGDLFSEVQLTLASHGCYGCSKSRCSRGKSNDTHDEPLQKINRIFAETKTQFNYWVLF